MIGGISGSICLALYALLEIFMAVPNSVDGNQVDFSGQVKKTATRAYVARTDGKTCFYGQLAQA